MKQKKKQGKKEPTENTNNKKKKENERKTKRPSVIRKKYIIPEFSNSFYIELSNETQTAVEAFVLFIH